MTRIVCGAGCILLLTAGIASVAVTLVRQHHRQQRIIKVTALLQLIAGKFKSVVDVVDIVDVLNDDVMNGE